MKIIILFALIFVVTSVGTAYAEPLERIDASIMESDGNFATVVLSWNEDPNAIRYEAGCVSCDPNMSQFTKNNEIILSNVTPLPNSGNIILYVVAYDTSNEIINAKQVFLKIH